MTKTLDPGQRLDEDLYRRLFEQRTLLLGEPLEARNSNRLCNALLLLAADDPEADIRLLINSPGGSVPGMLAIRDCMRAIPNDVSTVNVGMAYSAGQFLLSSGTRGKRYCCRTPRSCCIRARRDRRDGDGHRHPGRRPAAHPRHRARPDRDDTGQPIEQTVELDSRRDRWFTRRGPRTTASSTRSSIRRPTSCPDDAGSGACHLAVTAMSSYTIPYVTTRTTRGERTVDIYSRLLAERIVYLGTGIDDGVANAVIAQLLHLENENPEAPVSLYLNSPGGSIPATLAIYDAMQFIRPQVETTCVGQARDRRAVLAGGRRARRQILPHGRVVIHAPAAEGRGTVPDLILEADEVARVRALQEEILAAHRAGTAAQVREDTERDLVLDPEAAVDTASWTRCCPRVTDPRAADARAGFVRGRLTPPGRPSPAGGCSRSRRAGPLRSRIEDREISKRARPAPPAPPTRDLSCPAPARRDPAAPPPPAGPRRRCALRGDSVRPSVPRRRPRARGVPRRAGDVGRGHRREGSQAGSSGGCPWSNRNRRRGESHPDRGPAHKRTMTMPRCAGHRHSPKKPPEPARFTIGSMRRAAQT